MNQEEIIAMAREVGFDDYEQDEMLMRFAALVAAKAAQDEREACIDIVDNASTPDCGGWTTEGISDAIRARGQ